MASSRTRRLVPDLARQVADDIRVIRGLLDGLHPTPTPQPQPNPEPVTGDGVVEVTGD